MYSKNALNRHMNAMEKQQQKIATKINKNNAQYYGEFQFEDIFYEFSCTNENGECRCDMVDFEEANGICVSAWVASDINPDCFTSCGSSELYEYDDIYISGDAKLDKKWVKTKATTEAMVLLEERLEEDIGRLKEELFNICLNVEAAKAKRKPEKARV